MPCYRPLRAYRKEDGSVAVTSRRDWFDRPGPSFELPCGQCRFCRLERSRQWALRITHEAQLHERNSFITLTYDDKHLPADGGLVLDDWKKFAKRARARKGVGKFRYYMCGEYGEQTNRPHYHACIFGLDFRDDREVSGRNHQGDPLFTSPTLSSLWGKGMVTIGRLNWTSAAYVARYCMKKKTGSEGEEEYTRVDMNTGEVLAELKPPFATMSLKPALGAKWFEKYGHTDVYPHDLVVHDGQKFRPPRFYDKLLEKRDPRLLERMKERRRNALLEHEEDLTEERLRERERIADRRINKLKRTL